MRRLMGLGVATLVAALVPLLPGPSTSAAPPFQTPGDGCTSYVAGVCVVEAGDTTIYNEDTTVNFFESWYCDPSFGYSSSAHCRSVIRAGDTVRWVNVGTVPHTATECEPGTECNFTPAPASPLFGADILNAGTRLDFTFGSPGTWSFYCYLHPQQTYGTIQVLAPEPTATGTSVPPTATFTRTPVSGAASPTRTPAADETPSPTETPVPGETPQVTSIPVVETPSGTSLGGALPTATLPRTGAPGDGSGFPWALLVAASAGAVGAVLLGRGLLLWVRRRVHQR